MFRNLFSVASGKSEQDHRIDEEIRDKVIAAAFDYANKSDAEILVRIRQLECEWNTERLLEAVTGTLALLSVGLGFTYDIRWFVITGVVALLLLMEAFRGWNPALPVMRRLGFRTAYEIYEEKTALRILRGDLDHLRSSSRRMAERQIR
jgi:hypothetical protein